MVVVVVAVSKASSGRAWQSSSSYLSYILYTTQKRIRSRVFFWCVFGELFLPREIFFSLFFVLFSSKTQQTRSILDRHTL